MKALHRAAALLLFCLPASAATHVVVLDPVHGDVTPAEWSRPVPDVALAQGSVLQPMVVLDAGAPTLQVVLRTGGVVRFRPTGISAVDARAPRVRRGIAETLAPAPVSLGRGAGRMVVREHSSVLRIEQSWQGVDEIFIAQGGRVKHDLLLSEAAVGALGRGDVAADWAVELPPGVSLARNDAGGLDLVDAGGRFLARIPAPIVRDADDEHPAPGVARVEVAGTPGAPVVRVVMSGAWARQAGRAYPILLDPTVTLEPTDITKTGSVDELNNRIDGEMVSGVLLSAGMGNDVRAYAEFPLGSIPDTATILDTHLDIWIANHDNPTNPAVPLVHDVKRVIVPTFVSTVALYNAIPPQGSGTIYYSAPLGWTGVDFCPASFVEEDYDLGPTADADVTSQLPLDFITLGFTSEMVDDPLFDHIDYIGHPEEVYNPFGGCTPDPDPSTITTEFPGTRIKLIVTYTDNVAPTCSAGGPYASACRDAAIDGASVEDLDGDDVTYSWTSDRADVVVTPAAGVVPGGAGAQPLPPTVATLDPATPACNVVATLTLTVTDPAGLSSTCTTTVTFNDTEPPTIAAGGGPIACIWPPNHWYVPVSLGDLGVVATDTCGDVAVSVVGCVSDQPDDAPESGADGWNGDGHTTDDCVLGSDGVLYVRAERCGAGPTAQDGRHYGIQVVAVDQCGNASAPTIAGSIHVPHDQSPAERNGCLNPTRLGTRDIP